eukprot:TRINITY_DN7255_c1_g1_i1.p1 TRINITY_DN7255_c1_g1~~TRINITY_DN7255_c1_g1_i1.p1  ORF type:complete len:325 (-),score=39.89 TRINITY_DN7255_c1_g1_i1:220-1194(-)
MDLRIGDKYVLVSEIASSSRGHIYRGSHIETGEDVAVKLESVKASNMRLPHEAKMCKLLQGAAGVPIVHWYGVEGGYNALVMELQGPSLQDLFEYMGRRFSLKTVLMLADQMITRVENVHKQGLVHRNLKPGHFVIGLEEKAKELHLIDFGVADTYRDPVTQLHKPLQSDSYVAGTLRFSSINAHQGVMQSRRDDLESLTYVLMYFLCGGLPWQGIRTSSGAEAHKHVLKMKTSTSAEELCKQAPREFFDFCAYCRGLQFDEDPDYGYLKRSLRHSFFRQGYHCGTPFDWTRRARHSEEMNRASKILPQRAEDASTKGLQVTCT